MNRFVSDLRYGVRLLLRSPGFTAVAVAALAIGIGANTAIFSVVNTLLIQRLPYQDPERLAVVWEHNLPRDRKNNVVSPGNFIHWREMNRVFEDIAAVGLTFNVTLTGKNTDTTTVHFLAWQASLPVGVAILLSAVGGGLLTVAVGTARIVQLRRAAKKNLKAGL